MKTRAAVAFEAKKPLEIVELDLEGPKAGEVLVEIMATGICHTDAYTLDGFDSVKVCTGYVLDGAALPAYPDRVDVLSRVEPVYETLQGWGVGLGGVREPRALPDGARQLIELIESQVGVPVRVVGVGAERDDYLIWQ